jgi:hypothetical protein
MSMRTKPLIGVVCVVVVGACNTIEPVQFTPSLNQSAIVRDGVPAIVSRRSNSIVMVSPAKRGEPANGRLNFVVAINNVTKQPVDFHVADISASQINSDGTLTALIIIPYQQLVTEENTRQVAAALLTGVAAGANAYSAAYAGYGEANGTVYTPNGPASFTSTYYDPGAAAAAQANASAENDAMIANTIETGQRNLAMLERTVLKDNTIMPGEWVGGQVHISPPYSGGASKHYMIDVEVAGDEHKIDIVQGATQ